MADPGFEHYVTTVDELFRCGDAHCHEKHEEASNVRLIQEVALAIGRGDLEAVGALLTDDMHLEIQAPAQFPFIRSATGREAVLDALRHNFAAVRDQQPSIEAVVAQGDTVVVVATEEGELGDAGGRYKVSGMHRYVCKGGKIAMLQEKFGDV